jgi:RNA polymerase sigma factor (TIGR02999 family)
MGGRHEITEALAAIDRRGRPALDHVVPLLYEELKAIARRQRRRERSDHTLNTTDLVHEAYVKLIGLNRISWQNRAHLLAAAAQAMRRVLVDHALARRARKRGGGPLRITLHEAMLVSEQPFEELLTIDAKLRRLETLNPHLGQVVECRFFAGMSIDETAHALNASPATIKRHWSLARAWLTRELSRQTP